MSAIVWRVLFSWPLRPRLKLEGSILPDDAGTGVVSVSAPNHACPRHARGHAAPQGSVRR